MITYFDQRNMTEWAPVYVDTASIILVRRTPQNETLIKNHELAKSLFMTTTKQNIHLDGTIVLKDNID